MPRPSLARKPCASSVPPNPAGSVSGPTLHRNGTPAAAYVAIASRTTASASAAATRDTTISFPATDPDDGVIT